MSDRSALLPWGCGEAAHHGRDIAVKQDFSPHTQGVNENKRKGPGPRASSHGSAPDHLQTSS